ncbi:Fe(3+)-pyochelin receptor [Steroidobacter agaridevorans]|uniref:Fe(3+)-pyochelin receptor n=1 Tax=Steroidobacter agaridevorans TaxID=2695856 RepID=A0A829YLD3_9GAMM|nr:TonB-dependent siderophore receptor [Steroidobacter agaridevorans]GFE84177.1 Fe(3+)-pyochelin receptor [Steroidobacter agaridevorans]GFE86999.1 Fe(3+)-pyochelin receptor [Steroidobacter agaridevorans]
MRVDAASLWLVTFCWCSTLYAADDTLDEVIVEAPRYISKASAASKVPLERRQIPGSLSIVTEQRIADQNLTTVAEALAQVTGVTVIPNDGSQSQYKSRGHQLAFMSDGVPSYRALGGNQQLDLSVYERIEVLRGPTGLLQGSGEPAGSVNLVSKRGLDRFGLTTTVGVGRWDKERATVDVTGPLNTAGSLRARAVGVYEDRGDYIAPAHYKRTLGYGRMDWDVTSSTTVSTNLVGQYDRSTAVNTGLPAFLGGAQLNVPRSTSIAQPWNRLNHDTEDLSAAVEQRIGRRWKLVARWWQRDQTTYFKDSLALDGVSETDNTVPMGRREYDYNDERTAVDLFVSGEVSLFGRAHSVLIGYNEDRFEERYAGVARTWSDGGIIVPFDAVGLLPPLNLPYEEGGASEQRQSGFYLQTRLSLSDTLTLVAGGRISDFDSRSRDLAPATPTAWRQGVEDDDRVTPTAGILYDATRWLTLYASYADTFLPQSTLLRANGDPLDPRIGKQYEVGAKTAGFDGALQASIGIYDLRDTGRSLADPANPGFFLNAGEVESKGWEMEIVGSPAPGYDIQLSYSRLDSQFVVARADQVGVRFSALEPKHAWKLWAVRHFNPEAASGFALGAGLSYQSGIEFEPPRTQGGYTLASAMAEYRFDRHIAATFNADNLLDKTYYARLGGTNSYNTFGTPRNFSLRLNVTF